MGFIKRGFIWDIPILMFAYVPFGGPTLDASFAVGRRLHTASLAAETEQNRTDAVYLEDHTLLLF